MKLLTIVVKPSRSDGVKRALSTIGTGGATIVSAQGFGTQKGHSETYRGASYEVDTTVSYTHLTLPTTPYV